MFPQSFLRRLLLRLIKKFLFFISTRLSSSQSPDSSEIRVVSRRQCRDGAFSDSLFAIWKLKWTFFFPLLIKSKMEYGKWTAGIDLTVLFLPLWLKHIFFSLSSSPKLMESSSNYERKVLDIKIGTLWVGARRPFVESKKP